MIVKSPMFVALVMVSCVASLIAVALASNELNTDDSKPVFEEIARFEYSWAKVAGIGGKHWPTGFTYVSLDSEDQEETRFVLSAAYHREDTRAAQLRIRALDKNGNVLESNCNSGASGTGRTIGVTTLLCEIAASEESIATIIVEQQQLP